MNGDKSERIATEKGLKILIIDDDKNILFTLGMRIEAMGYKVDRAESGTEGLKKIFAEDRPNLVLLDLKLGDMNGIDFLKELRKHSIEIPVIVLTAYGSIETAVQAIKEGAYDYLTKPVNTPRLGILIEKTLERTKILEEVENLKRQLREQRGFGRLVGNTPKMKEIYRLIEQVAPTTASVLICGESGTGKELVARTIHELSLRREGPFIAINCSAIPKTLWESEIFGYEKGAFTGAVTRKEGFFKLAHGGTLFLDEVVEMSPDAQAKFLRVLEDKSFRRIGGTEEITADVRLLAATNRDPDEALRDGSLREDLYYRLNVFTINLPPLRERLSDIPLIVQHLIDVFSKRYNKDIKGIDQKALEILLRHPWPGNVRELSNVIERAVIMSEGKVILPEDLRGSMKEGSMNSFLSISIGLPLEEVEKEMILKTLQATKGNKTRAAEILKISLKTLHNKLKKYSLIL